MRAADWNLPFCGDNLSFRSTHNTVAMRASDCRRYLGEFKCEFGFTVVRAKLAALALNWKAQAAEFFWIWDCRWMRSTWHRRLFQRSKGSRTVVRAFSRSCCLTGTGITGG